MFFIVYVVFLIVFFYNKNINKMEELKDNIIEDNISEEEECSPSEYSESENSFEGNQEHIKEHFIEDLVTTCKKICEQNSQLLEQKKQNISEKGRHEIFLVMNNIVRKFFYGNTAAKKRVLKGVYYQLAHWLVMIIAAIVLLFVNNIYFLAAYVFVFFLDAFAIIILHDCPLTRLEEDCLKTSIVDYRKELFRSCGIRYECNHNYETQLDVVFNLVTLFVLKIGLLIIYYWFIQGKHIIYCNT